MPQPNPERNIVEVKSVWCGREVEGKMSFDPDPKKIFFILTSFGQKELVITQISLLLKHNLQLKN